MNRTVLMSLGILVLLCMSLSAGCSKPRVSLAVASQLNVNPDHSNRPSPVFVKIYELRNDLAFKQAEFAPLFNTPVQVLGADLVAADDLVFSPGEARRIAYLPNPNTRFVGVVAGFRQMDRAHWRVIKAVDAEKENWLSLELNDATILVIPDNEAEDWDPEENVRQFQQQLEPPRQEPITTKYTPKPEGRRVQPTTQPEGRRVQPTTQPEGRRVQPTTQPAGKRVQPTSKPATAKQAAKEALTIINPNGAETVPGGQAGTGSSIPTPPAVPGVSTPSLPAMRPI